MKKVLVTQRIDYIKNIGETRESIDQALSEWLIQSDFLPIPISNKMVTIQKDQITTNKQPLLKKYLKTIEPDAVLISGGNNIGEYPHRDITEYCLLSWAKSNKTPVLGICRGLQVMATWAGSELVKLKNHVRSRHTLKYDHKYGKFPKNVNSFHNFGLYDCPEGFTETALAEDNTVEAIKHNILPWEGWMWHPEREHRFHEKDIERLLKLFSV